jgi:hypothetical protein
MVAKGFAHTVKATRYCQRRCDKKVGISWG